MELVWVQNLEYVIHLGDGYVSIMVFINAFEDRNQFNYLVVVFEQRKENLLRDGLE